jgi:hypothetical protein
MRGFPDRPALAATNTLQQPVDTVAFFTTPASH